MRVGVLLGKPKEEISDSYCKLLYSMSAAHGIELFMFELKDIDWERKTINAWFYDAKGEKSYRKEASFPYIVEIYAKAVAVLPQIISKGMYMECLLSAFYAMRDKTQVQEQMRKVELDKYLINTHLFKEIDIEIMLSGYKTLMLKPNISNCGRSAYKLFRAGKKYTLSHKHKSKTVCKKKFYDIYAPVFSRNNYILQPFHNFTTNSGNPFVFKILLHRAENGEWRTISVNAHVGSPEGIMSKTSEGGYMVTENLHEWLEAEVGGDAKNIIAEVDEIAAKIGDALQKQHRLRINCLGLSLGINRDRDNALKIIEIDADPEIYAHQEADVVAAKVQNWKDMYSKREDLLAKQRNHKFI